MSARSEHENSGPEFGGINGSSSSGEAIGNSSEAWQLPRVFTRVFTAEQVQKLEDEFRVDKYLNANKRRHLASDFKLSEEQVNNWFIGRRKKWKSTTGIKLTPPSVLFTSEQRNRLEDEFHDGMYLQSSKRQHIAEELKLSEEQVTRWFKSRRAKWRSSIRKEVSSPTTFTPEQRDKLEEEFDDSMYPSCTKRLHIAYDLKLSHEQVAAWFSERRKQLKSSIGIERPPPTIITPEEKLALEAEFYANQYPLLPIHGMSHVAGLKFLEEWPTGFRSIEQYGGVSGLAVQEAELDAVSIHESLDTQYDTTIDYSFFSS